MGFLFFKEVYQFLAIVVSGIFELFYEPLIYAVYGFFEGIDILIFFVCDGNVIFGLPAAHDLFVAVDGVDEWFVKELEKEGYDDAQELVDLFTEESTDTVADYSDLDWPEATWNFACSTTETSTWADGGRKFGELSR